MGWSADRIHPNFFLPNTHRGRPVLIDNRVVYGYLRLLLQPQGMPIVVLIRRFLRGLEDQLALKVLSEAKV